MINIRQTTTPYYNNSSTIYSNLNDESNLKPLASLLLNPRLCIICDSTMYYVGI